MGFAKLATCKISMIFIYWAVLAWGFRRVYVHTVSFLELSNGSVWQMLIGFVLFYGWCFTAFGGAILLVEIPLEDFPGAGFVSWFRAWPQRKKQRELLRQQQERKQQAQIYLEKLKADPRPQTREDYFLLFPNCCSNCGSRDFRLREWTYFFAYYPHELEKARENVHDDKSETICEQCGTLAGKNVKPYLAVILEEKILPGDEELLLSIVTENFPPVVVDQDGKKFYGWPKFLTDTFSTLQVTSTVRCYSPYFDPERSESIPTPQVFSAPR